MTDTPYLDQEAELFGKRIPCTWIYDKRLAESESNKVAVSVSKRQPTEQLRVYKSMY
jgi:hypothetical protein